jgi:tRNA (guanine37-N1)-methyltransferase
MHLSAISTREMVKTKSLSIRVQRKDAESVRRYLRERNLIREDLLIKKDDTFIYFPIREITEDMRSYDVVTLTFEARKIKPASYKELLKSPPELQGDLPTSYDIVGDIILIKLPEPLLMYRNKIGRALLDVHPNIRTVCLIDPVAGELRTRNVTVIAGEKNTGTIHTEHGLSFHVDVQTTYFSPRLASERRRVADLVQPKETVVDMFAGVAPFSIMIARYAKPRIIYAVDKNKEAVNLAKQNVKLNHVLDVVEVVNADAKDIETIVQGKADRIIMNLPFSAFEFFPTALRIAANKCIVHYYDIISEEDIEQRILDLRRIAEEQNFHFTDCSIHKIKTYAPREFYIGIDITATKHADVA